MPRQQRGLSTIAALFFVCAIPAGLGQASRTARATNAATNPGSITLTVVDQNGIIVPAAQITIDEPAQPSLHIATDYAGHGTLIPRQTQPFKIRVEKPGFYQTIQDISPQSRTLRIVLTREEVLQQEVNVTASAPGIDTEQLSDQKAMDVPEIVNVPYPTNIDIRNLLPFTPGVIADSTGQVHVAGGETYMTLDTLDGFDIRSPIFGTFDLRLNPDAVRSIDTETTRYPVQYGRATGGIVALTTGMGDNKFRYDATNFIPSFRNQKGIRFDTFEPRFTLSGPMVRNKAWFFEAIDAQYSNVYIPELPSNADTNHKIRGSNLLKFQENLRSRNSLSAGLLFNDYHSPYEGISAIAPQQTTDKHNILAWLPYVRDQQSFKNGVMLDGGFGVMRYREGWEPHGSTPYNLTPELPTGSNFETQSTRSQRLQGYADVYFPPRNWNGSHQIRGGVDADQIGFDEYEAFAPVNYLREDGTLTRRSTFPSFAPFTRHNLELGAYAEDRWKPARGLLLEPGLRYDWDEIIRRPLFSPRIAMNYSPPGLETKTKFTAGIGVYYEHTQLEYFTRALAGIRYDTYYAADGTTPTGSPLETTFAANNAGLHEPRAINWSVGAQQQLPSRIYLGVNFMQKRLSDVFVYANQNSSGTLSGNYVLTNNRQDHDYAAEINARKTFSGNYALFASYTRSSATTNSALDYVPTIPILGPQQSGPLFWDVPNRIVSWGWLPAWAPWMPSVHKNWDFVYTLDWHSGFPFDSFNANEQIAGPAGSHRFPDFFSFNPGLEWRFHFRGKYFGLRGVVEDATDRMDPYIVYNNVDSPQYLTFSQPLGRAFTTRIRLIQSSR
ncbi:MAG TPA: TonB-dependent receptor [Acidobacteriaceae bacterium]|jgi:hypothetical protein|nr:TonB-dependent receptor [Acidobacteriaceae bacterium]